MLSEHATSEVDKKWLLILSSTSGSSAFNTLRSSLTCLLDLLVTFPSVIPPLARLVEHLPKLQPRYYSIASFSTPPPPPIVSSISSHHSAKRLLTFAFNVVEMLEEEGGEDAVNGRRRRVFRRGLATGWLDELVGGVTNREWTSVGVGGGGGHAITIPIFPKPASEFRFTKIHALTTTPSHSDQQSQPHKQQHLVMIAAGTGIAPFMGFLQHIKSSSSSSTSGSGFKQVWLIYGGRYEGIDGDVCYEEELLQYKREGVLTRLDICLSRQGGAERRHQERQGVVEEATATLSSSLSTDFSLTPRNKDGAFYWDGTYVQDVVWRTGDDVWKLVQEDKGHVFVCGYVT